MAVAISTKNSIEIPDEILSRPKRDSYTFRSMKYRIFADKRRQCKECSLFKSDCRNILLHWDSIFAATKIIGCNLLPCFPLSSGAVTVENLPGIGRSHFSITRRRSPSKSSFLDPILRGVVERNGERTVLTMSAMRSSGESMQIDSSGNWCDRRWSWTRTSIDARRSRARTNANGPRTVTATTISSRSANARAELRRAWHTRATVQREVSPNLPKGGNGNLTANVYETFFLLYFQNYSV